MNMYIIKKKSCLHSNTYDNYIPSNLKKVIITDATQISYGAFYNCSFLTDIVLCNSIISVDAEAFTNCSSITTINLWNVLHDTFVNNTAHPNSYPIMLSRKNHTKPRFQLLYLTVCLRALSACLAPLKYIYTYFSPVKLTFR